MNVFKKFLSVALCTGLLSTALFGSQRTEFSMVEEGKKESLCRKITMAIEKSEMVYANAFLKLRRLEDLGTSKVFGEKSKELSEKVLEQIKDYEERRRVLFEISGRKYKLEAFSKVARAGFVSFKDGNFLKELRIQKNLLDDLIKNSARKWTSIDGKTYHYIRQIDDRRDFAERELICLFKETAGRLKLLNKKKVGFY